MEKYCSDDILNDYFLEISKYPVLNNNELLMLLEKKDEEEIFNQIFESNLKLVVYVAKRFFKYGISLAPMDIIQEGNLGLIKAIKKYNVNSGVKFSYYATIWIVSAIQKALYTQSRMVRIPRHNEILLIAYRRKREELSLKYGREVTDEEIAEALNIDVKKIKKLSILSENIASLNVIIDELEKTELVNLIVDDEELFDDRVALKLDVLNALHNSGLSDKEIKIISLRYLKDSQKFQDIANIYNDSKQNIQQLEKKALSRIRKSNNL